MAKRFMYVCAGIFLLVATYHLGARSAGAQSSGLNVIGATGCSPGSVAPNMALVIDRTVYRATLNGLSQFQLQAPLPPIPGTSRVVSIDASCTGFAILENGDVWAGGGPSWSYVGNLLGGPTPVDQATWGRLKARYR
jgi:hypothetical protein